MKKVWIYGAGVGGHHLYEEMNANGESYEFLGFIDKRLGGGDYG